MAWAALTVSLPSKPTPTVGPSTSRPPPISSLSLKQDSVTAITSSKPLRVSGSKFPSTTFDSTPLPPAKAASSKSDMEATSEIRAPDYVIMFETASSRVKQTPFWCFLEVEVPEVFRLVTTQVGYPTPLGIPQSRFQSVAVEVVTPRPLPRKQPPLVHGELRPGLGGGRLPRGGPALHGAVLIRSTSTLPPLPPLPAPPPKPLPSTSTLTHSIRKWPKLRLRVTK